ncbi:MULTISPECIES: prenyltransferase/squalene oxidase repeat-containing protein [Streptacidiphilus]|uniref:Prenyltransferase/squalene oxidase repeat-containing protein n=1 Tax=Streptacidiphilus cavernicola TaxID=3342716 RepID=A0ABV6UFI5_9ACTN|nr:prenyltransferase/squalene oxidase repeat-containing protein [Streptacidiphilus jeojiense]
MPTAARLGAVALSAAVLTGTAAPAFASSASTGASLSASPSASPVSIPVGLYGTSDPTYDGVWRQGLSLLALHSQGVTPAASAVDWLTGQQCADGGWPSYDADPAKGCAAATEDTNATSAAVQALAALGGHDDAVSKAVAWYRKVQNADGGWSYNPGSASDANSTGLVVSALAAAKADPASVARGGRTALDGLHGFQLGCSAAAAEQGAFAYQPDKSGKLVANDAASAQAALATGSGFLPVPVGTAAASTATAASGTTACADSEQAAAQYLARRLGSGQEHLTSQLAGASATPDYASTAWAALSLAGTGHVDQARKAVDWLSANSAGWARGAGASADAVLILSAHATGVDPTRFGAANLVAQLEAAGPAPAATAAAGPTASTTAASTATAEKSSSSFNPWWLIGVGLVAGAGIGMYISFNRSRRRA